MNLNRKKASSIKGGKELSPITFDITVLDCFCKFALTDSILIRRQHLTNLQRLIDEIDPSTYENDIEKVKRYRFIKFALEMKLERHIMSVPLILSDAVSKLGTDIDFIDINDYQLDRATIEWVNDTVSETLQYSFIFNHVDNILDVCTRFKATDYRYRGTIVQEIENVCDSVKNSFRQARTENMQDMVFSLKDGVCEQCLSDTYDIVTSPSRRLLTMMQGLNEMLAGGFENSRVYMMFGMTAVGKSMTLLNIMYQIKMANLNYKTKDPTKTPCIVMLTMENSVIETITRLFSIVSGGKMKDYTKEEVIDIMRNKGQLVLSSESPIDIIIKYKPTKSVDTNYLYTMAEDLEDQGYEVIMLIQDHIKKIRSIFKNSDTRLELGDVVNEFKNFAIAKDIPVLSVSHLNREAAKIIENIEQSKKNVDATKQLGKSTVGESFLMLDNLDWAANINIDYDENGLRYMAWNVIKQRDDSDRDYMAQPFVEGSRIRLAEDLYLPIPLFKENLHESSLYQGEDGRKNIKVSSYADISALDSMFNREDNNIFEIPTKYTDMTPLEDNYNDDEYDDYKGVPIVVGEPSKPIPVKRNAVIFYHMPEKPKVSKEALYFY